MCGLEDSPAPFKHRTLKCKHFQQIKYDEWTRCLACSPEAVLSVLPCLSLPSAGVSFPKPYRHPLVTCCGSHVLNCTVASAHSLAAADSFVWSVRLAQEDILSQLGSAPEELDGFQYWFVRFKTIWVSVRWNWSRGLNYSEPGLTDLNK